MQIVLDTIRQGKLSTLGELVNFLRGPPDETFEGEKYPNAFCIRVPEAFIHFLQESYLPATSEVEKIITHGEDPIVEGFHRPPNSSPVVERCMMLQLLAAAMALRRLDVERATPFDNANHYHLNLLQQLWVAVGRPLSTYKRISEAWEALGFQGEDPTTDLRGGGVLALRQLVHFARQHLTAFREMIAYNEQVREAGGESWYLTAVVSIQFTAQLLLKGDHRFFLPHLEVIYDTVNLAKQAEKAGEEAGDSPEAERLISRRSLAKSAAYRGTSLRKIRSPDVCRLWSSEPPSDAEAGFFLLHESLLLFFKECWERDKPHVMSYNTYVQNEVFPKFFSKSPALPAGLEVS